MPIWIQNYDPFHQPVVSTIVAALPVTLLFYLLAIRRIAAHWAAVWAFASALALALAVFGMPAQMLGATVFHGLVYAWFRIAWTLVAAVWIYDLTVETGHFECIKGSIGAITDDRRLQVLLIAYAFGAVLEGAGGGGAPVAICGAMMVGLGFKPMEAAVLCLIANTAPVAWGGMGNPIRTLVAVTGLPEADLSATVGRILPWTALLLTFWLVRTQVSWRRTFAVWPGCLACGLCFGLVQFFWSNFIDAALVDIMGGMITLLFLAAFFKFWKPAEIYVYESDHLREKTRDYPLREILHSWSPFLLLSLFVVIWGLPFMKKPLADSSITFEMPALHNLVQRIPPVVEAPHLEPAVVEVAWLAAIGTATFLAGLIAGPLLGLSLKRTLEIFFRTLHRMRYSILAIACMICLGFVTRYSGMDAVLGLALTHTGWWYPLFGTLIGWLGVALTGTDAGSNALFGSLQVITANGLGLNPVLMAAANSAGGVMGKMIDAQSIIVACVATGLTGREGDVFRAVLKHSVWLALVVGGIVMLFAYAVPGLVPHGHQFW